MNKFEKVSFGQYYNAVTEDNTDIGQIEEISDNYTDLKLPKRATCNSAGYDFYAPFDFEVKKGEEIKIPTGIKCSINNNQFLGIVPRSSLGFKYGMRLNNTIGIIDARQ